MSEVKKENTNRRFLKGTVVATKMDKTAVVEVESKKRHPKYEKIIMRSKKYFVHDEKGELNVGDFIAIRETRPLSKNKRFTLHEILERAK
jgi:small subunit ribosomal protein S17